ncbi:hypothetical protein BZL30_8495 [Mycobacterium kansasii]|uniref:Uncharacterized protein n=1 Tax=Mycobacterium kansasii TaxID=1768 RepID=A0A1V3WFM7_MYCKA|nr:hypothetical protein BZL30_8495 [Mycobacterium kansasii]
MPIGRGNDGGVRRRARRTAPTAFADERARWAQFSEMAVDGMNYLRRQGFLTQFPE